MPASSCLTVDSFPDGQLNIPALERLQYALKLPLLKSIGVEFAKSFQQYESDPEKRGRAVIREWLRVQISKPATWRSFLGVLASSVTLHSLYDAVIRFFVVESDKVKEMEEQLEEATVHHLRGEMEAAVQRMEDERRAWMFMRIPAGALLLRYQPMKEEGEQSELFGSGLIDPRKRKL